MASCTRLACKTSDAKVLLYRRAVEGIGVVDKHGRFRKKAGDDAVVVKLVDGVFRQKIEGKTLIVPGILFGSELFLFLGGVKRVRRDWANASTKLSF